MLRQYCFEDEEDKILIETIIRLGCKYPLMFYPLHAFIRKRLRRVFFMSKCPACESRLEVLFDSSKFDRLRDREECVAETAVTIISDVVQLGTFRDRSPPRFVLNTQRPPRVDVVDESVWVRLKQSFGYRTARALVAESRLPCSRPFFPSDEDLFAANCEDVRLRDSTVGRDFVYNVASGRTAWVDAVRERDYGGIVRERWDQASPNYLPLDAPTPRLDVWKSGYLDVARSAKLSNRRSGKASHKSTAK